MATIVNALPRAPLVIRLGLPPAGTWPNGQGGRGADRLWTIRWGDERVRGATLSAMHAGASTIGVVIRTLNESELIGRCLEMLRRQRPAVDLDILVVDSGSTDATVAIARSHGARIVEIPPAEFGYSTALNLGIEEVRGDLVIAL